MAKKTQAALRRATKSLSVAQANLVREFVGYVKTGTKRGEVIVSMREALAALGLSREPQLVAGVLPQLREAGIELHHADLADATLPNAGDARAPIIGVTWRAPAKAPAKR